MVGLKEFVKSLNHAHQYNAVRKRICEENVGVSFKVIAKLCKEEMERLEAEKAAEEHKERNRLANGVEKKENSTKEKHCISKIEKLQQSVPWEEWTKGLTDEHKNQIEALLSKENLGEEKKSFNAPQPDEFVVEFGEEQHSSEAIVPVNTSVEKQHATSEVQPKIEQARKIVPWEEWTKDMSDELKEKIDFLLCKENLGDEKYKHDAARLKGMSNVGSDEQVQRLENIASNITHSEVVLEVEDTTSPDNKLATSDDVSKKQQNKAVADKTVGLKEFVKSLNHVHQYNAVRKRICEENVGCSFKVIAKLCKKEMERLEAKKPAEDESTVNSAMKSSSNRSKQLQPCCCQ